MDFQQKYGFDLSCVLALTLVLALTACSLEPVHPPTPDMPAAWQQPVTPSAETLAQHWWLNFNDPGLNQLIDKALQQAPDQRLALARINEARAQRQNATAQLFPLIQGVAGVSRTHQPTNNNTVRSGTFDQYQAGFDADWELDLFGRNRQTARAASATEQAAIANGDAVTLSLIAEIVRQYTLYQLYQQQAHIAQSNATAQSGIFKVSQARYDQGLDSRLELTRAQTLVQSTEAQVPLYQNLAQATQYQLDYLVGDQPGTNKAILNQNKTVPVIAKDVFLDVPLKVIRNRPDIMAAEQNVIAATALTQATIATLYPTITVSSVLGLTANAGGRFLQSDSQNWSLSGSVLMPLFDFGRIRSNIKAAEAREEQAAILYEQAVLNALRDVETTAGAYQKNKERYAKLDEAFRSSQKAVEIARRQYKEGILSQLDVLQAEQTAYVTQQDTTQAAADMTQSFIALCKALGLGLENKKR